MVRKATVDFMKKIAKIFDQVFIWFSMLIFIGPGVSVFIFNGRVQEELERIFQGQSNRAAFLGLGFLMINSGVKVLITREVDIKYPTSRDIAYQITGNKALIFGLATLMLGLIVSTWSGVVWVKYVIPTVLSKCWGN